MWVTLRSTAHLVSPARGDDPERTEVLREGRPPAAAEPARGPGTLTGGQVGSVPLSRGKSSDTQLIIYLLLKSLNTLRYSKFD